MTEPRNITYYFGAGASYHALPIQNELGWLMVYMASDLTNKGNYILRKQDVYNFKRERTAGNPLNMFAIDLAFFGYKSLEYGSIDTYARRLSLINEFKELHRLKNVVSVFFGLWHIGYGHTVIKNMEFHGLNDPLSPDSLRTYDPIDSRYIRLVASLLEKSPSGGITIPSSYNFISWNYDLQLERAILLFYEKTRPENWLESLEKIGVSDDYKNQYQFHQREYQITHLNGFHGIYQTTRQVDFLTRFQGITSEVGEIKTDDVVQLINDHSNLINPDSDKAISYENSITYAWEIANTSQSGKEESGNTQLESVNRRIKMAQDIIAQTDDLVIVGYSFPNFNKEVDRAILSQFISAPGKRIIYQGKENIKPRIGTYFNKLKIDIEFEGKLDEFRFPEAYI